MIFIEYVCERSTVRIDNNDLATTFSFCLHFYQTTPLFLLILCRMLYSFFLVVVKNFIIKARFSFFFSFFFAETTCRISSIFGAAAEVLITLEGFYFDCKVHVIGLSEFSSYFSSTCLLKNLNIWEFFIAWTLCCVLIF